MSDFIYLDHAAATPMDERVLAAMQPYFSDKFYNPSALYMPAQAVAKDLQSARSQIALCLGARPREITFTAGGTEANNLAIHGVMRNFPEGTIIVSSIEHDSVLEAAHQYNCREVGVNEQGMVDLAALESAIDDTTVLVSIMYANNEIGTIQPISEIAQLLAAKKAARTSKQPLYFHSDAAQAGNYLNLHTARLGVDLLTLNGGKIYGPKQSGALYVRGGVVLKPLIYGGGQEHGLRSGTENVAASIGLAKALDVAQEIRHDETRRLQALQHLFITELQKELPEVVINGSLKKRLPNNVHVTLPGQDNERLLIQLEQKGILAAAGSACSASNDEPSHVLKACGLSDEVARASLRFTLGRSTSEDDIRKVVATLAELL